MEKEEIIAELKAKVSIYEKIIEKSTFAPLVNERNFYSEDYVNKLKNELNNYKYWNKKAFEILKDNRLLLSKGALLEKGIYKSLTSLLGGDSNEQ